MESPKRLIFCTKLKKEAEGFLLPPFPGPLGIRVRDTVSKEAWDIWMRRQTMFINEYRLNMGDRDDRLLLLKQLEDYLSEDDEQRAPEKRN